MIKKYLAALIIIYIFINNVAAQEAAPKLSPNPYHLIKWTQEWCGPCQQARRDLKGDPRWEALNPEEVDPDELKTTDEKLFYETEKVTGVPTFVLYKEILINNRIYLREVGRVVGYDGKEKLLKKLEKFKR